MAFQARMPRLPFWLTQSGVAALLMASISFGLCAGAQATVPVDGQDGVIPGTSRHYRFQSGGQHPGIFWQNQAGHTRHLNTRGCRFCSGDSDNCDQDVIFPVYRGHAGFTGFAAICHVGAHSQRFAFASARGASRGDGQTKVTGRYAVITSLYPQGVKVSADRSATKNAIVWAPEPFVPKPAPPVSRVALPGPEPMMEKASNRFAARLQEIVAQKDLDRFLALLAEDVIAAFGGADGRASFIHHWQLDKQPARSALWSTLTDLIEQGADEAVSHGRIHLTWPYFFALWPETVDASTYRFVAGENIALRAGPLPGAPVLSRLSRQAVRRLDSNMGCCRHRDSQWHVVRTADDTMGYIAKRHIRSVTGYRLIAERRNGQWRIQALVAGD